MQIVLHTGAHFTEEERLARCLLRNKQDFSRRGVSVPGPSRYRKMMRDTMNALAETSPAPGARDVVLDAILDDEDADRVILSIPHFFAAPRGSLGFGQLYHKAAERMATAQALFPHDQIELFMAVRNPATFLPMLATQIPAEGLQSFFAQTDPLELRWSDTFKAIRAAAPQAAITVWCNEDTPLIWAQIIREMAGLEHGTKIVGGFDLLSEIMSAEGMARFRGYLKEHPNMTEMQKRRVIAAFLDKFAIEDEIEEEIDMPGWTDDLIEDLTDAYDEDVAEIARIPGVTLIAP
ncbi:MAG: hypothetical protein AAGF60_10320 [Pseudomonadota bacterium]